MIGGGLPRIGGEAREGLRQRLQALGFDEVRFAAAGDATAGGLKSWLAAGMHADMAWMERTAEKRADPQLVLAGVHSVILLGINYWSGTGDGQAVGDEADRPRWARYALNEDYHDTIRPGLVAAGRILEEIGGGTTEDYRYYVDTGPVLERGWAARSGLGFRGKNGMLISKVHGNWLFLASILTRLEIEPDPPLRRGLSTDAEGEKAGLLCGKCTRCLDACPTAAFPAPGVVDARRCISYQTIENKGHIPRELRVGIGSRIYGCDVCLEVCPWNRFARMGRRTLLAARGELAHLELRDLLQLTPVSFAELFKRTPIKRLKLTGLLRNACIVAGNSSDGQLVPLLVALASHASPIVRASAVWAVRRLTGARAAGLLAQARWSETDPAVVEEYDVT